MTDEEMFHQNVDLQSAFDQYVLDHPRLLERLPPDFRLLILPDDDPELASRNMELFHARQDGNKPTVVVHMRTPKSPRLRVCVPRIEMLATAG